MTIGNTRMGIALVGIGSLWKRKRKSADQTQWESIEWHSQFGLYVKDLYLLAEVEPDFPSHSLASEMAQTRSALISATTKARTFIWALIAFLLLTHYGIPLPISAAGLSLQAGPGVTEVIIGVVALATTWAWPRALSLFFISEGLRRIIDLDKRQNDLPALRHLLLHPEDPPPVSRPKMQPYLYWHPVATFAQGLKLALLFVVILTLITASSWWRIVIYGQVWSSPSIDVWWAHLLVAVVTAIDIGTLLYVVLHFIPLPHTNYAVAAAYNSISDTHPELARKLALDHRGGNALAEDFLSQKWR